MSELKKAVIPSAGLGTRFLPLTKCIDKNLLPLVARPMVSYAVEEAFLSGITNVCFITPEKRKEVLDYFKRNLKLEILLQKRSDKELLDILEKERYDGVSFSSVTQSLPKGDGDAVLKAKKQIGKSNFAVIFPDDAFDAKIPALLQLKKVFETSEKPVIGLQKVSEEKTSSYGCVEVEKIANRLYKIKGIVEKPEKGKAPSDLVISGRYIFTPEIFNYLSKTKANKKGEIILAEAIKLMAQDGKMIYGYEMEAEWLECGKTIDWLKSNLYLSLKHKEYGPVLKKYLRKNKLI